MRIVHHACPAPSEQQGRFLLAGDERNVWTHAAVFGAQTAPLLTLAGTHQTSCFSKLAAAILVPIKAHYNRVNELGTVCNWSEPVHARSTSAELDNTPAQLTLIFDELHGCGQMTQLLRHKSLQCGREMEEELTLIEL